MLKIAVFDSGFGGELFADYLEEHLPVAEITRIIDWRHATEINTSKRSARRAAEAAISQHIGHVDLIVFANFLLTATSLKYFRRKYPGQAFVGFQLTHPGTFKRRTLILATSPLAKTFAYHRYLHQLHRHTTTVCCDNWPALIDDGELTDSHLRQVIDDYRTKHRCLPDEIILACTQFRDTRSTLRVLTRDRTSLHDGYRDTLTAVCHELKLRGATSRKYKGKNRRRPTITAKSSAKRSCGAQ